MDDVMIALLPMTTDWCKIDYPHLTLVYSGVITDHKPSEFNEMAKDVASIATLTRPIVLNVKGIEQMGPPEARVAALVLQPTSELMALRHQVDQWDMSNFPSYIPHATIGSYPAPMNIQPPQLAFDRIAVCWGEDRVEFWLKR